jgi:hypothetical protein
VEVFVDVTQKLGEKYRQMKREKGEREEKEKG